MWSDVIFFCGNVVLGALVGLLVARLAPSACKRFAEWSLNPKRTLLFAVGGVFFLLCSVTAFAAGRIVYGVVGVAMALLEATAFWMARQRSSVK